jgi:hypothetical protein
MIRTNHPYLMVGHHINITKFKIKKHGFMLNIEIKLFYTIFIGWVMQYWANRANHRATSGHAMPSPAELARSPGTARSGPQAGTTW